jgi:hypothetical protein
VYRTRNDSRQVGQWQNHFSKFADSSTRSVALAARRALGTHTHMTHGYHGQRIPVIRFECQTACQSIKCIIFCDVRAKPECTPRLEISYSISLSFQTSKAFGFDPFDEFGFQLVDCILVSLRVNPNTSLVPVKIRNRIF